MESRIVIMGVAGCGKSSLAAELATGLGLPLLEGDDFHSPASRDKMARGIALTDADRAAWLQTLAGLLQSHPDGVVLSCSALKRAYRDQLRLAAPGLRFVFLAIEREAALRRVASRGAHFFSASLVDSQFATLEDPTGEPGVLRLAADQPPTELRAQAIAWLHQESSS
ncbi:MAG TPA: gluconokinase [Ramlibacter sp.]|nr:gluconokinase [Ramlibacter sp.]